mmetsp:Transcript_10418/g.11902  ORF Transcript_10418/g.11902 Transcript_10418/m.11902 type:complete len:183 (-) Transcript_10418:1089-1637(-)|eukprot:CAMPEP_0204836352 /NCGR_PEP_ID=MMETSP1346-20131115/24889_1 /ASSEMBLY_ACC=CAM_ASM_000771 /TAXON_ID=215587 /ORGANISM="Aplanochytrium stocchinoi, Strain GSBS06" /LENGTH=182 /DNA_ID=CAMNT_0051970977 /DNA_START=224 /DNA_END=772 /DNA_ORIENTATION=+
MEAYILSAPEGFVYAVDSLNELFLEMKEIQFESFLRDAESSLKIQSQNGSDLALQAIGFLVGGIEKYRIKDQEELANLLNRTTDLKADVVRLVVQVLLEPNSINKRFGSVPRIGKLVEFDWKLTVAMESSECENLSIPYITLILHIENTKGKIDLHCMDLTIDEFYKFKGEIYQAIHMMTSS